MILLLAIPSAWTAELQPEVAFLKGLNELELIPEDRRKLLWFYGAGDPRITDLDVQALRKANRFLIKAAEAGIAEAQYYYATTGALEISDFGKARVPLTNKNGVIVRDKKGRIRYTKNRAQEHTEKWLFKAADNNHIEANLSLGRVALLENDLGPFLFDQTRLPYLERAKQLGSIEAHNRLSEWQTAENRRETLKAKGLNNTPDDLYLLSQEYTLISANGPNEKLERKFLKQAADLGHAKSQKLFARYIWNVDRDHAAHYYSLLHDSGDIDATYTLGTYEACRGDADESRRYFQLAVDRGHPSASYAIAELNQFGVEEWTCDFPD